MHDLSLYLLEVIENSVRAGASVIATTIVADRAAGTLEIDVEDDGPGLPVQAGTVVDPFFTTKRARRPASASASSARRRKTPAAGSRWAAPPSWAVWLSTPGWSWTTWTGRPWATWRPASSPWSPPTRRSTFAWT